MNRDLTIEADALALQALAATLADDARADRLLALSGLDAEALKDGLGDRSVLTAILSFLEAHEPDLVAVAAAIGVKPEALVAARRELEA